ncbi:MAG: EAL domain-containing protein [Chromatiales bacterium]|jgi:diguanylate cyclase (GGDEF)-like protein
MFLESALWRTYLFILISSLITASAMLYLKWHDIKSETGTKLEYANTLAQKSMHSVLTRQASLLKILGGRLVELGPFQESEKARKLINEIFDDNPGLVGFGVIDVEGHLMLTSHNIDRSILPNLLDKPETAETLRKALQTDGMVLGRTYYMKALKQWLIPARYRITDESGKPVAVMSTGFSVNSDSNPWNRESMPENVRLLVVGDDKLYPRFVSGISPKEYPAWYNEPFDAATVAIFESDLQAQHGISLQQLRQAPGLYTLETSHAGEKIIATVHYDSRYEHFTVTSQKLNSLYPKLLPSLLWLISLVILFNATLYVLFRMISKIQKSTKQSLEFQATHDPLTGLPNRYHLSKISGNWLGGGQRRFSVLFIDLDNFKTANDLHGHRVGDSILVEVSRRLHACFDNELVIRQGGDEFIVLLKDRKQEELFELGRHFLAELQQPISAGDLEFRIGASIGISHYPRHGRQLDELLRKADMAMYDAKKRHVDIAVFSDALEIHSKRTAQLEKELHQALGKNELFLMYQPQIRADNKRIIGVEVLLRWRNDLFGLVPPDEFIPIAESTGLIHDIGAFVIEHALLEISGLCRDGASFQDICPRISINVSVQQLLYEGFHDTLIQLCDKHDYDHSRLSIEVTESLFIEELDKARHILEQIQQSGFGISLDDFGTGYSSLSVLNSLPIHELKIDKSFVHNILDSDQERLLIQSIISLGKSLNIPVVAEGVELQAQADMLNRFGCDLFQGYLFARPMRQTELTGFLQRYRSR